MQFFLLAAVLVELTRWPEWRFIGGEWFVWCVRKQTTIVSVRLKLMSIDASTHYCASSQYISDTLT